MIEEEFVPHTEALALKELGFDEPCIAFYNGKFLDFKIQGGDICPPYLSTENKGDCPNAPTFSQVFRWFREKYNLQCSINFYSESLGIKKVPNHYEIQIDYLSNNKWCYFENINNKIYLTYEEAELECLKKLIEIVKGNK